MGTRSITTVRSRWSADQDWNVHANIYRHWDGHLNGQGALLYKFLENMHVINGIPGDPPPRYANGPGRLAAILVTEMQQCGHDPDLMTTSDPCGQEFHYVVDVQYGMQGGTIGVTVFRGPATAFGMGGYECDEKVFEGSVMEYGKFLGVTPQPERQGDQ